MDNEVGSCIDISANYGYKNGDKRVIMDTLASYRADVYYNFNEKLYRIIGIKYAYFKYLNGNMFLMKIICGNSYKRGIIKGR